MEDFIERCFPTLVYEKNKGDGHQINSNWAKHPRALIHVQPKAWHAKAVAR
jgi:hypothetical protein